MRTSLGNTRFFLALVFPCLLVVTMANIEPMYENLPDYGFVEELEPSHCEQHFLSLSDEELWSETTNGKFVGKYCRIEMYFGGEHTCNYYAKGSPIPTTQANGLPRQNDGRGTGCIKDATTQACYLATPMSYRTHNLTVEERASMCTESVISNGASQIRYGIRYGLCMDEGMPLTCEIPPPKNFTTGGGGTETTTTALLFFSSPPNVCQSFLFGFFILLAYQVFDRSRRDSSRTSSCHLDIHYHSTIGSSSTSKSYNGRSPADVYRPLI